MSASPPTSVPHDPAGSTLVPPAGHLVRWSALRGGDPPQSYAPYRPLPQPVVDAVIASLALSPADRFVDFGSGDGRLLAAAARTAAVAVGVELDPVLAADSRRSLAAAFPARVRNRTVRVLHEPIGWTVPTGMTAGVVNLLPFAGRYLVPWLERWAPRGFRLVTLHDGFFAPGTASRVVAPVAGAGSLTLALRVF